MATQGTSLIINNLRADDVGTYTCTVAWAGQSVTHVLEVTGECCPDVRTTTSNIREEIYVGWCTHISNFPSSSPRTQVVTKGSDGVPSPQQKHDRGRG